MGRVAFGGVGHQPGDHLQQLIDASAGAGRDETDGYQVAFTQGLLKGVVQLLRLQFFTLFQVELHQLFVNLHHLVDDGGVGIGDGREQGLFAFRLEETVDDLVTGCGRQVQRQALVAEDLANLLHQRLQIRLRGVDLVDNDHAAEIVFLRMLHHGLGGRFDPGLRIDHHGGGFHRLQHAEGTAKEVVQPRGVEKIDVLAVLIEPRQRRIQGVQVLLLLRVEITDGIPLFDNALALYRAGAIQKGLYQRRFTGA